MNKRIKHKHLKKSNLERQSNILKQINKYFTIESKVLLDGYFIFNMGKNSVCHFKLKETPNWKYGIWLTKSNEFHIFGEHIELIDKFKPSQTYISFKNSIENFIQLVEKIKKNPKLYFVDSLTYGDALVDFKKEKHDDELWYSGYQVVRNYNEKTKCYDIVTQDKNITQEDFVNKHYNEYLNEEEQEKKNEEYDRIYTFDFFKEIPNLFEEIISVGIFDLNKDGWNCNPRYNIRVVFKSNLSQEKIDNVGDKLEKIVHDKRCSNEKKTYKYGFDLGGMYDDVGAIELCDYKYYKTKNIKS